MQTQLVQSIPSIREVIQKWNHLGEHKYFSVLKLGLLRDLVRLVHAERSRALANGEASFAKSLGTLETSLDHSLAGGLDPSEILNFLTSSSAPKNQPTLANPVDFSRHSPWIKSHLERFDRKWEKTIAYEAFKWGWNLWSLHVVVKIDLAEKFHEQLGRYLWPDGILLFTEASHPSEQKKRNLQEWAGVWMCLLSSEIETPKFKIHEIPGVAAPDLLKWTKL